MKLEPLEGGGGVDQDLKGMREPGEGRAGEKVLQAKLTAGANDLRQDHTWNQ